MIDIIRDTDTKTLMTGKHSDGVPYLKHVFRIYEELFQKPCIGCANNIPQYIQAIKNYKPKTMKRQTKDTRTFRLKKGVIIPIPGTRKAYSDHNITDEIAVKLISENRNRINLFEVLPKNIDTLLENEEEETMDDLISIFNEPFTIDEAKDLLKELGVNTKAETVDGVSKKIEELNQEQKTKLKELIHQQ